MHVSQPSSFAVACTGVAFSYHPTNPLLRDIDLTVKPGESVAIVGGSGIGKTTFLRIVDGTRNPDAGEVNLCGNNFSQLSRKQRMKIRRQQLGLVFQQARLIPEISVLENVMLPALFNGESYAACRSTALGLLERMGINPDTPVLALSGGQASRVGVARALINNPAIIIADEPTASLDPDLAKTVLSLLLQACSDNKALIIVTHDMDVALRCDRVTRLEPAAGGGATLRELPLGKVGPTC